MSSSKEHHSLAPDQLRCIWMTAGILSYQLCDRDFDCDNCPLDAAIRRKSDRTDNMSNGIRQGPPAIAGEGLREGLQYSRNHCWARKVDECVVRVGLEPGLSQALLTPKAIVLPSKGQNLQRRQTCLWIVVEGGTLPLESPCGGVVRATNHQLVENPHLLLMQPFDEGWLFDLEAKESALQTEDFLGAAEAGSAYAADQSRFTMMLANASHSGHPAVGITLADGGQRLQGLADTLGSTKYFSILRKVF